MLQHIPALYLCTVQAAFWTWCTLLSQHRTFYLPWCFGAKFFLSFFLIMLRGLQYAGGGVVVVFLPLVTAPLFLHSYATLWWCFSRTSRGPIRRPLSYDALPGNPRVQGNLVHKALLTSGDVDEGNSYLRDTFLPLGVTTSGLLCCGCFEPCVSV